MKARDVLVRISMVLLGVLATVLLLEGGLRLAGWAFLERQQARNLAATAESTTVLCVGESTTALGGADSWPALLQGELDQRDPQRGWAVVNQAIPGTDSSVLVAQMPRNLDTWSPRVVVAMMGANDDAGAAIPDGGLPVAERTGFPWSLRTWRLVRQLTHDSEGLERAEAKTRKRGESWNTGPPGPASEEAIGLLSQAWEAADRGELEEAERVFGEAVARDPSPWRSRVELGRFLGEQGRPDEAEAAFRAAAEACPRCDLPLLELARHLERQEEDAEAAQVFRRAVQANERSADAWFGLGRVTYRLGRAEEAAEAFQRVLVLRPRDGQAWASLGLCHEELGQYAEAEEAFIQGRSLEPRDRRTFVRLVDFYESQGRDEALDALFAEVTAPGADLDDDVLGRIAENLRSRGDTAGAERYDRMADEARVQRLPAMTRQNYLRMYELVHARGIPLVVVQYPTRSLEPLRALFRDTPGVVFVDNEARFDQALAEHPYSALFSDHCYGDFGHCTHDGCLLLAEGVADAILDLHVP